MKPNRGLQAPDLASSVRHDLRNPLGAIAHWVQLLETPDLDAELRQRALQGIRTAITEQLNQIEQLSELLEQSSEADPDGPQVSVLPPAHPRVDLFDVLNQMAESIPPALRTRLQRRDQRPVRSALIHADESALVQALTTLATLGLKQLLDHEQLLLGLQSPAPLGACRMVLQVQVVGEPIERPWRILSDTGSVRGLAVMHARSVLSLHRADVRIVTTDHADDTVILDFPLIELAFDET
jgi:hypothetical protein